VEETGIEMLPLNDLLESADVVTVHTDLNPTSYHLIGASQLSKMKSTAYLINTSRGPAVNEAALIEALLSGAIAGAALDVFEKEPLPSSSPLLMMDNVLLAPHSANSGIEAARRVHQNTINNLLSALG
jgi:D-3-phosphoglycerate dehydrogenase